MPFIPLWDRNPIHHIKHPYVTYAAILICIAIFVIQSMLDEMGQLNLIAGFGMTPAVVLGKVPIAAGAPTLGPEATLLTYAFLHSDTFHLATNTMFLFTFGNNIEDAMGHVRYALFLILCAILAAAAQVAGDPEATRHVIGSSGAIAGVLGAYLVLHPCVDIWILLMARIPLCLPAYLVTGSWMAIQIFQAILSDGTSNIAWWAHSGGFAAGAILILIMRRPGTPLFDMAKRRRTVRKAPIRNGEGGP